MRNGGGTKMDWTTKDGKANNSDLYKKIAGDIEKWIREDASQLLHGHANMTARLILGRLAHRYKMEPKVEPFPCPQCKGDIGYHQCETCHNERVVWIDKEEL